MARVQGAPGGGSQDGAPHPPSLELLHLPRRLHRRSDQFLRAPGTRHGPRSRCGGFTLPAGSMIVANLARRRRRLPRPHRPCPSPALASPHRRPRAHAAAADRHGPRHHRAQHGRVGLRRARPPRHCARARRGGEEPSVDLTVVSDVAGGAAGTVRRRRGVPFPGTGDALLPAVPAVAEEYGDGDGGHARGARVLPQHGARRRRTARHGVAAGQHERLQAGEPVLAAHRARRPQLWVLSHLCQALQVPEHGQVVARCI